MVGLLAAGSIFAGINFSGEFNGGYAANISFDDASGSFIEPTSKSFEGKLNIKASDDDGIWSIEFKNLFTIGSASADAKATINFDKLAALLGSDWGSWKFSMVAGNNPNPALATAYNKKVGGFYSASKANAVFPMVFTVGDGNWVDLQIGVDPTFGKVLKADDKGKPTTSYGSDLYKVASFLASAKSTPIDGLNLSLGYIFNVNGGAAHAIEFDFALDLAKMVGTSFDLIISGGDTFSFGSVEAPTVINSDNVKNVVDAGVYAGIDLINGCAEVKVSSDFDASKTTFGAKAGVASNFGVDGLGFSATLESADFSAFADNFKIGAEASYGFSFGLTTTLSASIGPKDFTVSAEAEYDFGGFGGMTGDILVKYTNSSKVLSITPTLGITF